MRSNNRLVFITVFGLLLILLLGIWQELSMPFNDDICYAILVVQKLVQGKHFFTDFMNTNPPLAFYIYLPVLLIHTLFHFNIFLSHRLYIIFIALSSLFLSNYLLGKLLEDKCDILKSVLLLVLTFSFILLPHYEFGQRSHIAVMLIFPYLILLMLRLKNIKASLKINLLIGISAGIGFALNPFYLFLFFFCEIVRTIKRRPNADWLTSEATIICLIQALYFVLALRFYPNYFHKIIPLAYNVYLPAYTKSFIALLKYPYAAFSAIILIASIFLYRLCRTKELAFIFIIANISFLLSYFLQRKIFYYHVLPAMTVATLQSCYLIFELAAQLKAKTKGFTPLSKTTALIFVIVFLICVPLFFTFYLSLWLHKNKESSYVPFVNFIGSITKPNQSVAFFTFYPSFLYSASIETKTHVASRFDGFWFLPGMIKFPHQYSVQKYKSELIGAVVEDLKTYKPNYIFIDKNKTGNYFGGRTFEYLKFFKQSQSFRAEFSHYTFFKTFKGFAVYKRGRHPAA